jgi:hypothetical protein
LLKRVGDELEDEDNEGPRQMTRDDFEYAVTRIDRMELSIANIINKIDRLFSHLGKIHFRNYLQ